MLSTPARLLRLLSLLQARRFWTGADLAERLEVTARTLRRDVDRLRQLGYPVHSTSGVAGGYQLGAGAALPPLQLDDDEALAVSIALGTAATSNVRGIDEAAVRALVKLEQVLPSRLRQRADALRATIIPMQQGAAGVSASLLSALASACRDHTQLTYRYSDRSGRASERHVEPQGLVHASYRWYLVAWDLGRADFRTFRVDRIEGEPLAGPRFTPRAPPDGGDLRTYVSRALSLNPYEVQASVILHAPLKTIAERFSPASALLERIDDDRCRMQAGASSLQMLAAWILMTEVDFEIERPDELVDHMRTLRSRLTRVLAPRETPRRRRAARG